MLEKPPLPVWVKGMLALWIITLPVTLWFAALSAMAGESGYNAGVYVLVGSAWTYPAGVIVAFLFRRKYPRMVLLPFVNVALWLGAGLVVGH